MLYRFIEIGKVGHFICEDHDRLGETVLLPRMVICYKNT